MLKYGLLMKFKLLEIEDKINITLVISERVKYKNDAKDYGFS